MRRFVHRPDANQEGLVKLARRLGASVAITSQVGDGFPDLVIGFQGRDFLVEVKVPGGDLRPKQETFIRRWRGQPVSVIDNGDDLARLLLGAKHGGTTGPGLGRHEGAGDLSVLPGAPDLVHDGRGEEDPVQPGPGPAKKRTPGRTAGPVPGV